MAQRIQRASSIRTSRGFAPKVTVVGEGEHCYVKGEVATGDAVIYRFRTLAEAKRAIAESIGIELASESVLDGPALPGALLNDR